MERNKSFKVFWLFVLAISLKSFADGGADFKANDREIRTVADSVLKEGRKFETQGQWGEALSHYEEAIRIYRNNSELLRRMQIARIHFDLERRYSDRSFLSVMSSFSQRQAMELLTEVLLKIESHYVNNPHWQRLMRNGTSGLGIAMRDPEFVRNNRIAVSNSQIRGVIQHIWNAQVQRDFRSRQQVQEFVHWASQVANQRTGISATAAILEYTSNCMSSLDPYSTYLTADQLDDLYSQIEGNFVGLGIELKPADGALLIADVIESGPAFRSGIKQGDRIVEVDGKPTKDYSTDKAADMLKGEQGTYVRVSVLANDGRHRTHYIRRERVEVPSVEDVKMMDPESGIGYLKISSFQKTTSRDVHSALWELNGKGMRILVLDVRGNPGGLLPESVEVADHFITNGTIVRTKGRNTRENYAYKAHRAGTWRVPLVVLVDGDSASASEIFAGAIQDHRRGTVVGERTYGKGSVQGIFPLRTIKAGVRLTTAKFYSPSDRAISLQGVEPDVVVTRLAKPLDDGGFIEVNDDDILEAGTKVARNLLARDSRLQTER